MSEAAIVPEGPGPFPISRRTLLIGLGGLAALGAGGYWVTNHLSAQPGTSFAAALKIPPLLAPRIIDGEKVFHLSAQSGETELVSGAWYSTMGYNGGYLGPTIRASRGDRVRVHVDNDSALVTTAHWHGMRLPATQDGNMHQSIKPATTWTAAWLVDQPAATLWYHPHPHGQTELQVGRGMAGLFIVDDNDASELPSEYGVDDVPLIIQDVALQSGGMSAGTPTSSPIGRIGNAVIVNGTHQPRFEATTDFVRFRVLNASAARCYNLQLSDQSTYYLVGTDGGLLPAPEPLSSVLISPAERVELLIRVAPGADVVLLSTPNDLGMSDGDNIAAGAHDTLAILRITRAGDRASSSIGPAAPAPVPADLPAGDLPEQKDVSIHRRFELGDTTINGQTMDMDRIDTVVSAGSTELWTVTNTSRRAHNFHIHGTQFTVHSVNGKVPPTHNRGRKDTVFIAPNDTVELFVPFGPFADPNTPYMYHCHMLWHEDQGMMAQYVVA